MDLIKCMNGDFSNMSDEDLDKLVIQVNKAKERRLESRKLNSWEKVIRAVQDYVEDYGWIELFTEELNGTLDADNFRIPGEINLLD